MLSIAEGHDPHILIAKNACHNKVTPNGGSGISAIYDMTFLSQRRRRRIPNIIKNIPWSNKSEHYQ